MKELKTLPEIETYINDLERQVFSLKNTHAFRVGLAIMKFYDKPNAKKILELNKLLKEIISATKKVTKKNFSPLSKVILSDHIKSKSFSQKSMELSNNTLNTQYYYLPIFKEQRYRLSLSESDLEQGYVQITPYNFERLLKFGNFDEIEFDLSILARTSGWRNFGTYDDIHRTKKFLDLLRNNKLIYKKLIHSNNLILFPILLDCIDVFDHIVVDGEV